MKLTNPSLLLNFLGNDLEPGKQTQQTVSSAFILNRSVKFPQQLLNGLKSSSDSVSLQLSRDCASTEDIIATDGDIEAVLKDGEDTIFTGFVSTSFRWEVTQTGETALAITLEGRGTRLLSLPYIDTGKVFFDNTASAVIYMIASKVGISLAPGMDRVLLQNVSHIVEAGTTCKELLDQLCYECNAVYYFNNLGQLCIFPINPSTENAEVLTDNDLFVVSHRAVTLQKKLRTYKGARVQYWTHGTADNYLVYRNTTGANSQYPYCNLELQPGEYFDGIEIYSEADWSAATQDTFREPALIGAVNAESETQLVGSNQIVNISNLNPVVEKGLNLSAEFENVGGGYFKLTCHNSGNSPRSFFRLDLYASIVYQKSIGVIRTQIDGVSTNKTLLEEEMKWIHTKEDAQKHANLLAQYHRFGGATYTFNSKKKLSLGSVIHLQENLHSGLDVYVMLIAREETHADVISYTAVGISTFNLDSPVYYGQTEEAKESGKQGPQGEPGTAMEVQYALGDSPRYAPTEEMTWQSMPMLWDGEAMVWNEGLYSDEVPEPSRGQYIWMRTRIGDAEWQYSRLTGASAWDAENLGIYMDHCPTQSNEGLGLMTGDYFLAGATFTDPVDGNVYSAGCAYVYLDGYGWDGMDITMPSNSAKALDLLSSLSTTGITIPSSNSVYSLFLWAKNFVAQNAVIANLISRNIQVGDGDGTTGSGFRFRAKAYDADGTKLTEPIFDVFYGDKRVFQIDVTSGDIFFGGGLIYHAATDTIEANSAVFNGIQINNANGGEANFGSAVFSQANPQTVTLTINSNSGQGRTIYDWILTTFGISGPSGATPGWYSEYFSCSCSRNSSVAFVRAYRENFNSMGVNTNLYAARFYTANKQEITALRAYRYETSQTDLNPFSVGDTISTVTGGNIMQFFGLPTQAAGLASGRVWNDNGTLKIVT